MIPTVCGCEMLAYRARDADTDKTKHHALKELLAVEYFARSVASVGQSFLPKGFGKLKLKKQKMYTEEKRIDTPVRCLKAKRNCNYLCTNHIHVRTNIVCPKFALQYPKSPKIQSFSRPFPMSIAMTCGSSLFSDKGKNHIFGVISHCMVFVSSSFCPSR